MADSSSVNQVTEKMKEVQIDASQLTALSQEVISRQATVSRLLDAHVVWGWASGNSINRRHWNVMVTGRETQVDD